jgi:hypothetical protein
MLASWSQPDSHPSYTNKITGARDSVVIKMRNHKNQGSSQHCLLEESLESIRNFKFRVSEEIKFPDVLGDPKDLSAILFVSI